MSGSATPSSSDASASSPTPAAEVPVLTVPRRLEPSHLALRASSPGDEVVSKCTGEGAAGKRGRRSDDDAGMVDPLPPALATAPFTVARARELGVEPSRLRRVDLRADFRGVRVASADVPDLEALCRSYAVRLGSDRYFSHETAAVLWGMRLPWFVETATVLHVTTVRPSRTPRIRGVVGHHADPPGHELVAHRGFLLPSPAETWRMLSARFGVDALVVAGDGLLARRHPLATLPQLRRAVARNAGMRGNARLRAALERVRAGTDSARETWLRCLLVDAGLPEPEVNAVVSAPGRRLRFGDLVYRAWRVLVEYEGVHHQASRAGYLDDIDRFDELSGWRIVRIAQEHSAADAVARVSRALVEAGWRP